MPKLATCLWYANDAEAAANFYVSLLPDSHVDRVHYAPNDYPGGKQGDPLLVEFTLAGHAMQGLNGGEAIPYSTAASISVECDDQAEVDRLWAALTADGGKEVQCGWLNDRWGVPWQIVPRQMLRLLSDPDRARARRAFDAMGQMVKLDVAELERAAAG
jgi:predicted 3-demethylubiquinone-9 3-methyltransferase (glyoxalase superfamily)